MRLEREYHLDASNPSHIWLLHHLFLEDLNNDCDAFQENWNSKGVSGRITQHRSPNVSCVTYF
jgi:hypothetical protein